MLFGPKSKEQATAWRYGAWAGNPGGRSYQPDRCAAEVADAFHISQCGRKNGHGREGLYCRQHAKKDSGVATP